jgi:hypothetical protein
MSAATAVRQSSGASKRVERILMVFVVSREAKSPPGGGLFGYVRR